MNKNDNLPGEALQNPVSRSGSEKKWLSRFAFNHGREIFSAVAIGVLVTIISTVILDKFFYADDEWVAGMPEGQFQPNYEETQVNHRFYWVRANLAQVLSALTPAKLHLSEFYMMEGRFPASSEEFDISLLDLDERELITGSYLTEEGGVGVSLSADFGEHKHLLLQPDVSTNGAFIKWRCETNIDEKYLGIGAPKSCIYRDDL